MSIKIFPVQSKSYSGFFKISTNTFPFSLRLDNSSFDLKLLGFIPYVKVNLSDVISFSFVGSTWVVTQKIFNGVVVKYKKGNLEKERVFSFFSEQKSLQFIEYLRTNVASREIKK